MRSPDVALMRKKALRKALVFFRSADSIDIRHINWSTLKYNKNNQRYQMLIGICYLVIQGLLQTEDGGKQKLSKQIDDQKMHRLYERFILAYFKAEHPKLKTNASQIEWNLDDARGDRLPIMQSDITLSYGEKMLIIDAKYYGKTMQHYERFGSRTLHSGNLYQIFTYVKNQDKKGTGDISGMLLYAKTDKGTEPDNEYRMSGNKIIVRTLDLGKDFALIRQQLDEIARNCNRLYLNAV